MNTADQPNQAAIRQDAWKNGMVETFRSCGFTHAVTLSWNRSVSILAATQHLKTIHGIVDRELLGCRYTSKSLHQRSLAVFVFEGTLPGGHLHVHSLWRIAEWRHFLPFMRMFFGERGGPWNRIVSSGSYSLSIADDPDVFARYALKGQHPDSPVDEMVWSTGFLPN